jgi:hypothetical protein
MHAANPVPDSVIPFRLNRTYTITIAVVHLLGLLSLFPFLFSWTACIAFLIGIHVFGQAG